MSILNIVALSVLLAFVACDSERKNIRRVFVEIPNWPLAMSRLKITVLANPQNSMVWTNNLTSRVPGFFFELPNNVSHFSVIASAANKEQFELWSGFINKIVSADTVFPILEKLVIPELSPGEQLPPPSPPNPGSTNCNSWIPLTSVTLPYSVHKNSLWGADSSHIWFSGSAIIMGNHALHSSIYFWDGQSASEVYRTNQVPGLKVAGGNEGICWAARADGITLCNGQAWGQAAPFFSPAVTRAIWAADQNNIWVSVDEKLFNWDGVAWSKASLPGVLMPYGHISKIWGYNSRTIWVLGNGNIIFHWNGSDWTRQYAYDASAVDIWGNDKGTAWVLNGSTSNQFYRWNGSTWLPAQSMSNFVPKAIFGFNENYLIAVGSGVKNPSVPTGKTITWDGTAWRDNFIDTDFPLTAIWASDREHIYALDVQTRLLQCVYVDP